MPWPRRQAKVARGAGRGEHAPTFDVAILDVNLNGETTGPVAEALAARGMPFVFATGYGEHGLPDQFRDRPLLKKPFQIESLKRMLRRALPTELSCHLASCSANSSASLRHERLVGEVEPQRRHRDAVVGERRKDRCRCRRGAAARGTKAIQ